MQTRPGTRCDVGTRPPRLRRSGQVSAAILLATMLFVPLVQPGWANDRSAGEAEQPSPASGLNALRSTIQEHLSAAGGQWSVSVGVPGVPEATIALDADRPMLSASLFKLVLLVEALRLHRAGELDLDERLVMTRAALALLQPLPSTVGLGESMAAATAMERMITISSNTGAVLIGQRVGWRRSEATVARLGLHTTSMASQPTTTAADMQRLLRLIAGEPADPQLLHPDDAATMRHLLGQQRINDRVPPELHRAGLIAHKTGDLPRLLHDAGLITGPDGPIAVVLMVTEFTNRDSAVAAMRDVYRAIHRAAQAGVLPAAVISSSGALAPAAPLPTAQPTSQPAPPAATSTPAPALAVQRASSMTPHPTETKQSAESATPQPTTGAPQLAIDPNAACCDLICP